LFDRLDDVGAGALGDFEGQSRLAIDPGDVLGILEGRIQAPDVAEADDGVSRHLDRHVENVVQILEEARHLDGEAAAPRIHFAGRDHAVVAAYRFQDGSGVEVVAFQRQWIDDQLDQLIPIAADLGLQHVGNALDLVLQVAGYLKQRPLGNGAAQSHHQDREEAEVDLVDAGFLGVGGKFRLGDVDLLAHVRQRLVDVIAGLELHEDHAAAKKGGRTHLLPAFDGGEFLFHRLDQQAFRVFR